MKTWRSHREQHSTQRIVTLINTALTALSCSIDTADGPSDHGILDRPKGDGNESIPKLSVMEGHRGMRDRGLDQLLPMDDKGYIRRMIKMAFEPIGGLVIGPCVSSAFAPKKVSVFNRNLILIDMIPGMDGMTVLEILEEWPKSVDIPFFFNALKMQSHETEGLKTTDAVDAIVEWFASKTLPDRVRKAQAVEHG